MGHRVWTVVVGASLAVAACGSGSGVSAPAPSVTVPASTTTTDVTATPPVEAGTDGDEEVSAGQPSTGRSSAGQPPSGDDAGQATTAPVEAGTDGDEGQGVAGEGLLAIDWWGCWRAADARAAGGGRPGDGERVATVPNCASGPSSVGPAGDLSHPDSPPLFRPAGAAGHPAIEFTFEGDTLLQTSGGAPWTGDEILPGAESGVTVAWIGMMTDVGSHDVKYLVSGLSDASEYPQLLVEGEGPNRFAGYAGGAAEARSGDGSIRDDEVHGVLLHLAGDGSASSIEVDGDARPGQDSAFVGEVAGLTLGNHHRRGFSTTDHRFVFLGLHRGPLTDDDRERFWRHVDGL